MEQTKLENPGANEQVVPRSETTQLRVRKLKRLLGKKTLEAEI